MASVESALFIDVEHLPCFCIADDHAASFSAGDEPISIRRKVQAPDLAAMIPHIEKALTGGDIPEPNGAILACGSHMFAVG